MKVTNPFSNHDTMDAQTKAGQALIKAAGLGKLDAVDKLIAKGVNIDYQDDRGWTALMDAIMMGRIPVVQRLLKAGANLILEDREGNTAIHIAAMSEEKQILEDVFFELDDKDRIPMLNRQNKARKTPLIAAAEEGTNTAVLFLLKYGAGADLNIADDAGLTAIFYALQSDRSRSIIQEFLNKGAKVEVDRPNMEGSKWSALIWALSRVPSRTENIVYTILDTPGVDVNVVDDSDDGDDNTPLHYAVKDNYSIGLITALLDKGADINARNMNGETPLLTLGDEDAPEDELLEKARLLLDRGADINAQDEAGTTPLMLAVIREHVDTVKLLLERGAKKELQNEDGETALNLAQQSQNEEIITLLEGEEVAPTTTEMWAGYTQADAQFFDSIVENEESLYRKTFCPVCLQHGSWEETCKYLTHKCKPAVRHERLYNLYKDRDGSITWCAVCGRHGKGHGHYPATDGTEVTRPEILPFQPGAHVYKPESCPLEGGGGPEEKIRRVDGLLKQVCEAQKDVGKRPNKEVRNELIEAAWKAAGSENPALVEEIKAAKKFKNYCDLPTSLAASVAPDIPNPNPLPTGKGVGMCSISLDECETYEFVHVQPDGPNFVHEAVGKDALLDAVKTAIAEGKEDVCPLAPESCKGKLHPAEIKEILPEIYEDYRKGFNQTNKVGGGARRGGSVTTPFDDVQCALPEKKAGRKARTYRKIKKTRRGKRSTYRRRL